MNFVRNLTKNPIFYELARGPWVSLGGDAEGLRDELNAKIASGEIVFEEVSCLCGGDSFSLIADFDRYGIAQKR